MVLSQIKKPQVYLVTINIVKALSTYVEFNEGSFSFHVNVGRQRVQVPFKTNPQNTKGAVVYLNLICKTAPGSFSGTLCANFFSDATYFYTMSP